MKQYMKKYVKYLITTLSCLIVASSGYIAYNKNMLKDTETEIERRNRILVFDKAAYIVLTQNYTIADRTVVLTKHYAIADSTEIKGIKGLEQKIKQSEDAIKELQEDYNLYKKRVETINSLSGGRL